MGDEEPTQSFGEPTSMKCSEPIRASSKKEIELPIALGLEHKWRNLIPRREVNSLGFSLIGGKVRRLGSTDV
jgi:hypothetical protein